MSKRFVSICLMAAVCFGLTIIGVILVICKELY